MVYCYKCGRRIDYVYAAQSLDEARKLPLFWGEKRKGICHAFTTAGVEFIHFIIQTDDGLKSRLFIFDDVAF